MTPPPFLPSWCLVIAALTQAMARMAAISAMAIGARIVGKRPTPVEAARSGLSGFMQSHVFAARQQGEMVGIHTGGVLANMVDIHSVWDRAVLIRPRTTMGALPSVHAVAVPVGEQRPVPTPGLFVDHVPRRLARSGAWLCRFAFSAQTCLETLCHSLASAAITHRQIGTTIIASLILARAGAESSLFRHAEGNRICVAANFARLLDAGLSACAGAVHMRRYLTGENIKQSATDGARLGDKITGHFVDLQLGRWGAAPRAVTAAPRLCVASIIPQIRGIWGTGGAL